LSKNNYLVILSSRNIKTVNELAKKIEALLFIAGDGMTIPRLASFLKKSDKEIETALENMKEHLSHDHYLAILRAQDKVSLVTTTDVSKLAEDLAKEEFSGELTRAALDTLAIVSYKGPIKRSEIDYIRGVNSSFTLRNLLMRGIIERKQDTRDSRSYIYRISSDFLKFVGLTSITDLPEYGSVAQKLEEFLKESEPSEV